MLATQNPTPVPTHLLHPTPTRTNADLNISVLRRHNHHITSILSIAPYAVIYIFNPASQTWEKSGIEGSLFVCQLAPQPSPITSTFIERYAVHVLNRRGLDNFSLELTTPNEIEVTEEYIILQGTTAAVVPFPPAEEDLARQDGEPAEGEAVIYGLWVFAEPEPSSTAMMREINAGVIMDCAIRAEQSRGVGGYDQVVGEVVEDVYVQEDDGEQYRQEPAYQEAAYGQGYANGYRQQHFDNNGMVGRQAEQETQRQRLLGLFGGSTAQARPQPSQQYQPQVQQQSDGFVQYPQQGYQGDNQQPRQDVLDDLFRRARQGHSNG